jgi:flavin reductase (DIM6/NTAB) family NADH-FMN oxidoreductase RutF
VNAPDIDAAQFRQLLGRFTTGVTVLTTRDTDGRAVGMTANSIASVSLRPPLLAASIGHEATLHTALLAADEFVVNILAESQEAISRRFAGAHADRFEGIGYTLSERGLVLLDGAHAHIECRRHALVEAGDHTILIGRVVGGATGDGRPLLYYRGGYAVLG